MMDDTLNSVCLGRVFIRDGIEWEVIGVYQQPTVILQRVGLRHLPIDEHTRVSVAPGSRWAEQWKAKT